MTSKAKNKEKPKFKTILADPYKKKFPTLKDDELEELRGLLLSAIDVSAMNRNTFAGKRVRLGLESSMRAINNRQCACVFISLSLNPKHVIGLIGRNIEFTDETVPVFVQPQLEVFTKDVFGISAMMLVLPSQIMGIHNALDEWLKQRKKPKKAMKILPPKITTTKKKKTKQIFTQDIQIEHNKKEEIKPKESSIKMPEKTFGDDFISFSTDNAVEMDKLNLEEEENALASTLSKMTSRIAQKTKVIASSPMDIDIKMDKDIKIESEDEAVDEDDFLEQYHPLTVHKIRANPDKKPKKKRKNKKVKK